MAEELREDIREERYQLVLDRIKEIEKEHFGKEEFEQYFSFVAAFIQKTVKALELSESSFYQKADLEECKAWNKSLYEDILPENYEDSYANPEACVRKLGEDFGRILSFLYYEMRSLIAFASEKRREEMTIRMELFAEVYGAFAGEWQENGTLPSYESIRGILYWFVSDYADEAARWRVHELTCAENNFAVQIMEKADFSDERYLYAYGEYITDNELRTARFLAGLSEEKIALMADTYTEGYRIGFVLGKKDLSKKKTVEIRYALGFERMIKKAIDNFRKMGLEPVIYRAPVSFLYNPQPYKSGFFGACPNRQYDMDHKNDRGLFLDRNYINRKLEVWKNAFEEQKEQARGYAGPAVLEIFGEEEFAPVKKKEAVDMTPKQAALWVEYRSRAQEIQMEYIPEEERSFTIIAFPIPAIGDKFEEIFEETIKINTLDTREYQEIQQRMIDMLDQAHYCEIKGAGANRTDLVVSLFQLTDPARQTIFENCVADVNIPVGEVFTSPVLKGTNGILHVSRVFLNGLEYHDLAITFKDGMITDYHCANFEKEEDNRQFIKENILFNQETLPMGEFAIGTNTTAYAAARKYGIEAKLPILIAEKTGPHFAVGDTCYSNAEEIVVYNPDGKEIAARDNEVSLLRKTDPSKAYFHCHTDITIPYDELAYLGAVTEEGKKIPIIENGRFVLPGCEELNKPLESLEKNVAGLSQF